MAGQQGVIRIVPEELREEARKIESHRDVVVEHVEQLNTEIQDLTSRMEGQANTAFLEGFNEMYNPTLHNDFPEMLTGIATQLDKIAEVIERADEELQNALRG